MSLNKLKQLPKNIYKLINLKKLNISQNNLTTIPLLFDKLKIIKQTKLLNLKNNNIKIPPQKIYNQNTNTLFSFLKKYKIDHAKHKRKIILINTTKTKKTNLKNTLILDRSKLTTKNKKT